MVVLPDVPTDPIDPYQLLHIVYNPNDTLTRLFQIPSVSSITTEICTDSDTFFKDVPLNAANKTWLRVFRPIETPCSAKLPIVFYFHGGGFILFSASNTIFHKFCASMADNFPALIVSIDYRLAPENRLPAAYEDAIDTMNWVRQQALEVKGEKWFKDLADFSKCYLMGCSSGGNIVYRAGLHAVSLDLKPLTISGFILNQPYFGSSERKESELRLVNDKVLPLVMSDLMWELALPKGSDRDHQYCNPTVDGEYGHNIGMLAKCFVSVRGGDPLMDHQLHFEKLLKDKGVKVVSWFDEAGYHGMELFEEPKAHALFVALRDFIYS